MQATRPSSPLALDVPRVGLDPGIRNQMATNLPLLIHRQAVYAGPGFLGHLLERCDPFPLDPRELVIRSKPVDLLL